MTFDEEGNGVITKAELLKILKANHMASHDAEVARKADTIMVRFVAYLRPFSYFLHDLI